MCVALIYMSVIQLQRRWWGNSAHIFKTATAGWDPICKTNKICWSLVCHGPLLFSLCTSLLWLITLSNFVLNILRRNLCELLSQFWHSDVVVACKKTLGFLGFFHAAGIAWRICPCKFHVCVPFFPYASLCFCLLGWCGGFTGRHCYECKSFSQVLAQ